MSQGCGTNNGHDDDQGDDEQPDDDDQADDDDAEQQDLQDRCFFYRDDEWDLPESMAATRPGPGPSDQYSARIAGDLHALTDDCNELILSQDIPNIEKHRRLQALVRGRLPGMRGRLAAIEQEIERNSGLDASTREQARLGLLLARYLLDRLERAIDYDVPDLAESRRLPQDGYEVSLDEAMAERYWKFYHWSEILGAFNDDSEYLHLLEGTGREGFIDDEVGRRGVEAQMDWWHIRPETWDDPGLTGEQKLMTAKYTMWQNPDWGGGDHYINEYWSWEPAFTDEDSPLFTGNMIAALSAEYAVTQSPRTFRRLRALVDMLIYDDELSIEGDDHLDTGPRDGRIQRGPKMKPLYFECEEEMFDIIVNEEGRIEFVYDASCPDERTGRERKNASRDQYYGLLTGYYTLYTVFSRMNDLSPEEEELYCDAAIHLERIVGHLRGPRFNPDHGPMYNIYSLIEGSQANPPNLSFMGYMAADWFEDVSGLDMPYWEAAGDLINALLDLGALIGTVELSQELFEPAHSGLTALNQYLAALLMSDQPREHWEFIFPGEIIRNASQGRRNLWRRLIAAYIFKFGDAGNEDYQAVIDELLDPAFNPPREISDLSCGTRNGHVAVCPQGWGLEDLMWPLMFVVYNAQNSNELGDELNTKYEEMIDEGALIFEHTDVEPAE